MAAKKKQSLLILPCHKSHIVRPLCPSSSACGDGADRLARTPRRTTSVRPSLAPHSLFPPVLTTRPAHSHLVALLSPRPRPAAHRRRREPQHARRRPDARQVRRLLHPQDVRRRPALQHRRQGVHRAVARERQEQCVHLAVLLSPSRRGPDSGTVPSLAVECFIEGTRSRTGKLLPPKLGILKNVLEALEQGRTEDVWICPISLQYDKVRPRLSSALVFPTPATRS